MNGTLRQLEDMVRDPKSLKPELAYLHYNCALILYHKRQLKKALKILKPLQRLIKTTDTFDEVLSAHVVLLTMVILGDTADYKQANTLLEQSKSPGGGGKKYLSTTMTNLTNLFPGEEGGGGTRWDFKDMWQLIGSRVDVLNRAEVKLKLKPDSIEYCVLRAHQHFLKHDLQLAAKELLAKQVAGEARNGDSQNTVLANDMGLIHFSVRHYAMAVRFFQYALNFDSLAPEQSLVQMPACRRPEILYNLGISMLFLERPQDAFDCLLVPLNYHHNNPRLWLRLAEACILMHRLNVRNRTNTHLLTCGAIGSGMLRKFILKASERKYKT